ncbi:MAG: hypothetical protein L3J75_01870, partial [Methylococcaceae bacterium]|nr:hypothetical protein [Methylococcaceae bacterium]
MLAEFIVHLPTSTDAVVQAVEKPQNSIKLGKIGHRKKGNADGQLYPLRLQPKRHGCYQLSRPTSGRHL